MVGTGRKMRGTGNGIGDVKNNQNMAIECVPQ